MRFKGRFLFQLSQTETNYFKDNQNKIELLSCHQNEKKCKTQLSEINRIFSDTNLYFRNNEFERAIDALQTAFEKTNDLKESTCINCVQFFRSTITQSLENIHSELEQLSKSLFRNKNIISSYLKADKLLQEFKSVG